MSNAKRVRISQINRVTGGECCRLTVSEFTLYAEKNCGQPEAVVNSVLAGKEFSNPRCIYRAVEPTLVEHVEDIPGMLRELGIQQSTIVSVLVSRATGPSVHLDWQAVEELANRMQMVLAIESLEGHMHSSLMIDGVEFVSVKKVKEPDCVTANV